MFSSNTITALALLAIGTNAQYVKTKPDFVDPAITSGKAVGDKIPPVGFGTWTLPNSAEGANAVARAIALGYRHIDGATAYGNQPTVAKGIAKALKENPNIKREELWVTTKIWATRHKDPKAGMDVNLQQLGLDYVDLALIHFPVGNSPGPDGKTVAELDFVQMWQKMEELVKPDAKGFSKVRHIGISNFNTTQIETLLKVAKVKPYNHQIEAHPYLQDWAFYDFHQRHGIPLVAYAPLGNQNPEYHYRNWKSGGKLMLNDLTLKKIAGERGCTTAQVALAWNLARNVTVIPKAFNAQNAIDNYEAHSKCKLTSSDMTAIRALDQDGKGGKRYWDMFCSMGIPGYFGLQDGPTGLPVMADYCVDSAVKAAGLVSFDASNTAVWSTPKTVCQR